MTKETRKFIDKIKTVNENLTTLFHGNSDNKKNYQTDEIIFLSTSSSFAKNYGDDVYAVKVNLGNVFNSLDLKDVKLLYKNGFKLYDPNVDEDWDDIGYDFEEDAYLDANAFINSPTNNNTWDVIESNEGLMDWIFSNNFDSILITEDGIENYITTRNRIKSLNKIE